MKKHKLLLLALLIITVTFSAKGLKSTSILAKNQVDIDTVNDPTLMGHYQKMLKNLGREKDSLANVIDSISQVNKELANKYNLKDRVTKEQESKISKMEKQIAFADSVIARLSNDCLRKKYDEQSVKAAIYNFEQMYSPELKSKFAQLKVLLNNYGRYTKEIVAILNEAQKDKDIKNPFKGKEQAKIYIDKIKGTEYYRNVYDANWTIPYLNKIIDKSIEILESYNPRESKEIHLLELME